MIEQLTKRYRVVFRLSLFVSTLFICSFGFLSPAFSQNVAQNNLQLYKHYTKIQKGKIQELRQVGNRFRAAHDDSSLTTLTLPVKGKNIRIRIRPHTILANNYESLYTDENGIHKDLSSIDLFYGDIENSSRADDFARLSLITDSKSGKQLVEGFLSVDGDYYNVSSDIGVADAPELNLTVNELSSKTLEGILAECGVAHSIQEQILSMSEGTGETSGEPVALASTIKVAEIATEADFEMHQSLGSEINTNARIASILNGVDAVYQAQLGVRLSIVFSHVWTTVNDPYTQTDIGDLLSAFGTYWNANFLPSHPYDLAHLFTGQNLSGNVIGIAWLSQVCRNSRYGLSEHVANSNIQNYSVPLVAHEMGHNFGSGHDTDCSSTNRWIMCPSLNLGANTFSPSSITQVNNFLASVTCLSSEGTFSVSGTVRAGSTVSITGGGSCSVTSGNYSCINIPAGANVTITPTLAGYTFSPASRTHSNISANLTGQNFSSTLNTYSITGSVTSGSTVSMSGGISCPVSGTAYTCSGISHGTTVTITPTKIGYTFSPLSRTHSNLAQNLTGQNFTGTQNIYSITGTVISGATVAISGISQTQCPVSGSTYTCSNIPHGTTVIITPSRVGYTFSPAARTHSNLSQSLTNQSFTGILNTYSITGSVNAGATVSLSTGASCNVVGTQYTCSGIAHGSSVTITPQLIGYLFSPASRTHSNVTQALSAQNFTGILTNWVVSGSVPAGTNVSISGGGSCSVSNTTYTCSNIPHGATVTVTPSMNGYSFSPPFRNYSNISQNFTLQNFSGMINTYAISGSMTPGSSFNIVGGGSCSVGPDFYTCSLIPSGATVTITPSLIGYTFNPTFRTHSNVTQNLSNQNFVGIPNTYSISGTVSSGTTVSVTSSNQTRNCPVVGTNYSCTGIVHAQAAIVTPTLIGYTFTPATRSYLSVTSNLSGQNFSAVLTNHSISGYLVSGATLTLQGAGSCSVANNQYLCSNIPHGQTIVLTPRLAGYAFTPESRAYQPLLQDLNGEDFLSALKEPIVGDNELISPLYSLWNGFLGMTNVLELINTGSAELPVTLQLYNIAGQKVHQLAITLSGNGKKDIILNGLNGFRHDSYGVVKLIYNGTFLNGGMYFYRPSSSAEVGDNYEFSFMVPLENTLHGPTSVGFNTFHPSRNPVDANGQVFNWLSIVNLDGDSSRTFKVQRYDQSGQLLSTRNLLIPALGRIDIDGGHGLGRGVVGYNKITPENNNVLYKAELIRYGTKGNSTSNYSFAFPLLPSAGGAAEQWVSISSGGGGDNWIEVINTANSNVSGSLTLYDNAGRIVFHNPNALRLNPRQQKHFHASNLLPGGMSGAAKIKFNKAGALVSQSMFYFFKPTGSVAAMYGVPGTTPDSGKLVGAWNMHLNMYNWLRVFNTTSAAQEITIKVHNGSTVTTKKYNLNPRQGKDFDLHNITKFHTSMNNSDVVELSGTSLQAELLRIKPTTSGGIDFIEATPISARSVAP